ncbi:ABC transporter permease [Leifsonia xyli]|uniref:ABC transporter permease n=1 Tax=Leifsonia xyli TaxID=1575 RepID=UPI003D67A4BE
MTAPVTAPVSLRRTRMTDAWWRADPVLTGALVVCALLFLMAVFGPLVAPYDPLATDILSSSQPPSWDHLLGTDSLGRDIFSRILVGARLSFLGPIIIVSISITFGVTLALLAAWKGGVVDSALSKVLNVMFAVPAILVAVIAVAVFGGGFWAPVLALALVYIPYVARVIRSSAIQERRRPYVEAFQLAGMSGFQINLRHILRNLTPLILAQATLSFGSALIDFGALSFVGLGVPPPTPEWGAMVNAGRAELLAGSAQQTIAAGAIIVITVVAYNVLGERITQRLGAF